MAHMMKHTKASCGHIFAHFDRRAEHISNENLDRERTHLNYNLATHQQMNQGEFVRQRCSEVRCQNRKDINVMVSWVITAPKDLPEQEHRAFFKASYDFCKERYGEENVVSAYVHMDEVTPHMHFAFVPIVQDKKRGGYKVSAKECVNRNDLQTYHKNLEQYVSRKLGHEVGILNEATKEGNKSIEELKRQSATERLQEATKKASIIVSKAHTEAQTIKDSMIAIKAEYEAKKAYVRQADKVSDVSMMYPNEAKVTEKGLIHKQKFVTVPAEMWEAKHISANEKGYLQQATKELEKQIEAFKGTASARNIASLTKRIKELERENSSLRLENRALEIRVYNAEQEADKTINKINKVLGKLPDEVADQFIEQWNKKPQRSKGFDIEK
jgi:regulator of replication initiation timing